MIRSFGPTCFGLKSVSVGTGDISVTRWPPWESVSSSVFKESAIPPRGISSSKVSLTVSFYLNVTLVLVFLLT